MLLKSFGHGLHLWKCLEEGFVSHIVYHLAFEHAAGPSSAPSWVSWLMNVFSCICAFASLGMKMRMTTQTMQMKMRKMNLSFQKPSMKKDH